jgi:hypothetical protein
VSSNRTIQTGIRGKAFHYRGGLRDMWGKDKNVLMQRQAHMRTQIIADHDHCPGVTAHVTCDARHRNMWNTRLEKGVGCGGR